MPKKDGIGLEIRLVREGVLQECEQKNDGALTRLGDHARPQAVRAAKDDQRKADR